MDYWQECVEAALNDAGLVATTEQIEQMASVFEGAYENYGLYSGNEVASKNLAAHREDEMQQLRNEIERERRKITCRECNGTGEYVSHGPYHSAYSTCFKCNGAGRHDR